MTFGAGGAQPWGPGHVRRRPRTDVYTRGGAGASRRCYVQRLNRGTLRREGPMVFSLPRSSTHAVMGGPRCARHFFPPTRRQLVPIGRLGRFGESSTKPNQAGFFRKPAPTGAPGYSGALRRTCLSDPGARPSSPPWRERGEGGKTSPRPTQVGRGGRGWACCCKRPPTPN